MRRIPRRLGITQVDLLVCLLVLLFVSTISFAQLARARETANRIKCASHLKQIGLAILLYSNENRGAYPRGRSDLNTNVNPKPVWGTPYGDPALVPPDDGAFVADPFLKDDPDKEEEKALLKYRPAFNDVTAALFQVMRTQDITSEVFVCPSTELEKFEFGGGNRNALAWTNWPGNDGLSKHLSYSYQNPYPSRDAIGQGFKLNNAISAEYAVASDMNPGGDALLKLTVRSTAQQMRDGNSYNHNRDGQNVLFGDGRVEFVQSPFVGVQRDNIFTFGKSGKDTPDKGGDGIAGSPVGPNDSILLPAARDIGQVDEAGNFAGVAKWTTPAAQQADALRDKIVGEYEQASPDGAAATLKITKDQIIATSGPITITFAYTIDGLSGADSRLKLTAPNTKPESAQLSFSDKGVVSISKNQYFEGQWKRRTP
jgi:hypothetical protein